MELTLMNVLSVIFLTAGILFSLVSVIGVLRLPDYFTRLHAMSIGETVGLLFIGVGLMLSNGFRITDFKLMFVVLFVYLGNPIGNNVLGRAACKAGYMVWTKDSKDVWNKSEERIVETIKNIKSDNDSSAGSFSPEAMKEENEK